jgi:hypothetical protein
VAGGWWLGAGGWWLVAGGVQVLEARRGNHALYPVVVVLKKNAKLGITTAEIFQCTSTEDANELQMNLESGTIKFRKQQQSVRMSVRRAKKKGSSEPKLDQGQ